MKVLIATLTVTLLYSLTPPDQIAKTKFKEIGGVQVYAVNAKSVYMFEAGMNVDADGSPRAYHPTDNSKALDYLANAGSPGDWRALATDNKLPSGNPFIQIATDPFPGYYVSQTALFDKTKQYTSEYVDPNRFVNAEVIPYVVVPFAFSSRFKKGDIAWVINTKNGMNSFAIAADVGSVNEIGEGSIKLAQNLGINSDAKRGGVASGVIYIFIQQSGQGVPLTVDQINTLGSSRLTENDKKCLIVLLKNI